MAYRVAANLSQSPLVVSDEGHVLAAGGYAAVQSTDGTLKHLLDLDPAPLRLLTPSELKGELPAEVQAAVDEIAAREDADEEAAAAKAAAEASSDDPAPDPAPGPTSTASPRKAVTAAAGKATTTTTSGS